MENLSYEKWNSIKNKNLIIYFETSYTQKWNVVSDGVAGGTNAMKAVIQPAVRHDCSLITFDSDSQIYSYPKATQSIDRPFYFHGETLRNLGIAGFYIGCKCNCFEYFNRFTRSVCYKRERRFIRMLYRWFEGFCLESLRVWYL